VFSNKKVFITGGSSGIGKQLAADFLRRGAHVTIMSNDSTKLERARVELTAIAPSVCVFVCDVSDPNQVRSVATAYLAQFGPPDVLVSNAGYAIYRTFEEIPSEEITRLLAVNLVGACLIVREFLTSMLASGRGDIVVVASIAGCLVMTPCGVYSAAKHALVAWAHTLKLELHRAGIRVHVICPGRVETEFFSDESFVRRLPRKEAQLTIPVLAVSRAVLTAIEKNRFMTYVPKSYGLLVWLVNAFPFIFGNLLDRLMLARIDALCRVKEDSG